MNSNKYLIFVVAYNHEKLIEKTIKRIPASVLEDPENEILVIDDGSKDNTFYVTDEIRKELSGKARITVLKNPINQGYGGNQKLGYKYAVDRGFDRVILVHGDGQYAPELLSEFIKAYNENPELDAVFGTRMFSAKSALSGGMPFYKLIGNKILTRIQNLILKSNMSEFHSGYRSYSTSLLKTIPFEANSNDFHFDTEIIIQALAAKANMKEIPIPTYYGDEICHVNGVQYAWNVVLASLHFRLFQFGFLYDRKYELKKDLEYPLKTNKLSSHSQIVNLIPDFSRVLDIGCGKGYIAKQLIAKSCIVDGIDVCEKKEISADLRNYYKIDLIKNIEALKDVIGKNEYDIILMADIIEHLVEPEKILDIIRSSRIAKPIPKLIVSTGNVGFFIVRMMLFVGQFNYGVRGILDRTHVRLFTKKSLKHIIEQSGYRVNSHCWVPMPFTSIFGENFVFGNFLENLNAFFCRILPGLFSYQFIIQAEPLPTTEHILSECAQYSEDLRDVEMKMSIQ